MEHDATPNDLDPYAAWFGIHPGARPPTPEDLLGVAPGELDEQTILDAAIRRKMRLNEFGLSQHAETATRLAREVADAMSLLMRRAASSTRPVGDSPQGKFDIDKEIDQYVEWFKAPVASQVKAPRGRPGQSKGDVPFDAYSQWLGIPSGPRPPSPEDLLGIWPGETDERKILDAAARCKECLDRFLFGSQSALAAKITEEVREAAQVLWGRAATRRRRLSDSAAVRRRPVRGRPQRLFRGVVLSSRKLLRRLARGGRSGEGADGGPREAQPRHSAEAESTAAIVFKPANGETRPDASAQPTDAPGPSVPARVQVKAAVLGFVGSFRRWTATIIGRERKSFESMLGWCRKSGAAIDPFLRALSRKALAPFRWADSLLRAVVGEENVILHNFLRLVSLAVLVVSIVLFTRFLWSGRSAVIAGPNSNAPGLSKPWEGAASRPSFRPHYAAPSSARPHAAPSPGVFPRPPAGALAPGSATPFPASSPGAVTAPGAPPGEVPAGAPAAGPAAVPGVVPAVPAAPPGAAPPAVAVPSAPPGAVPPARR